MAKFVVMVAETEGLNSKKAQETISQLTTRYGTHIESGLLEVITN